MDRDDLLDHEVNGCGWKVSHQSFSCSNRDWNSPPDPDPHEHHHTTHVIHSEVYPDGSRTRVFSPEIIIHARDFVKAQSILRLIAGGFALTETRLLDDDLVACPVDENDAPPEWRAEMQFHLQRSNCTHGHTRAARAAATASRRKTWRNALAKYYHGFRVSGVHWLDTHPRYGSPMAISRDPMDYVAFSLAIISFYSALEELNAHVIASASLPSRINGSWNPRVLSDLRGRLSQMGVDPDQTVPWIVRGAPSRIEHQLSLPPGQAAEWSRGPVRDRLVPICDAIGYASALRSRVSAHRVSRRTESLTLAHVCNVQMVARKVLLGVLHIG